VVTKAIFLPSGDQRGALCTPQLRMNGFSPRSIGLASFAVETFAL
jgi:hypothetical protein